MAYITLERTRAIAIRMALGAQRGEVLRMVLQQSMTIACIGLVLGLAAALLATRLLTSLL
ncbi:MAG: FtsX-like permease family protein [Verrucomicrobiota bacterium]|nr:FtsX-like permease family protein [Verrucomicrobiota bacterium]